MARATLLLIALAIVCSLAVIDAQCIECKDCKGSNTCLSKCQKSCAPTGSNAGVNIETCKNYGNQAGKDAAKFACDLTLQYCRGGPQPRRNVQKVSLGQCGNIAFGVCQSYALDKSKSPCGSSFNGGGKCSKSEFAQFYNGVVDEQCNQKSAPFDKLQQGK